MKKADLRLISSFESFKALEHDWNNLYKQSKRSTIFSSWDWMITWWEVFQEKVNSELFILCLYQENQLVGLAPFHIENSYPLSLIQGKTLRFIGSSNENEIMTEFSDFIVKEKFEREFIEAVSEYLIENKQRWGFADFEFLKEDALVLECFKHSKKTFFSQEIQYGGRYFISSKASLEDYLNSMKPRWSKTFKRKNRILERDGKSEIEEIDKPEDIKPMFDRLADMHKQRWQGKLDTCVFDMPEFCEFHLKILERLVPKKKANIKTLTLNDVALASFYTFEDKGQIHYYQSGFYKKHSNRYSPLFLLICKQIGKASYKNKTFDFMFDDDLESYKREQYAAKTEKMYRLKLTHQPFKLILLNFVIKIYRGTKWSLKNKLLATG